MILRQRPAALRLSINLEHQQRAMRRQISLGIVRPVAVVTNRHNQLRLRIGAQRLRKLFQRNAADLCAALEITVVRNRCRRLAARQAGPYKPRSACSQTESPASAPPTSRSVSASRLSWSSDLPLWLVSGRRPGISSRMQVAARAVATRIKSSLSMKRPSRKQIAHRNLKLWLGSDTHHATFIPMEAENRLVALKLVLPHLPTPGGNYLPAKRIGNLLYLSGVTSVISGSGCPGNRRPRPHRRGRPPRSPAPAPSPSSPSSASISARLDAVHEIVSCQRLRELGSRLSRFTQSNQRRLRPPCRGLRRRRTPRPRRHRR